MPPAVLFTLLVSVLVPALAVQVPLVSNHRWRDESAILRDSDCTEWSIEKSVNPNVTDHLIFETVYSLLQHWPNTRMRNGHNIAPGTIPKGTLLYHGTTREESPLGPEWVSTDPEHSHIFCRELVPPLTGPKLGCRHLTLAATRPLRVVYFDGSSSVKLSDGPLDAQDLLVWGETRPDVMWDETPRIEALCKWGRNFGVDAFVRMEMDFEIMLCDFTSGVNVVSFLNTVRESDNPTNPSKLAMFEVMYSGSWHNRFPGETRIQLDLAGLVSFYDTQLVPSLVPIRVGQERWDHRVRNISGEDMLAVKSRLEAILTRPSGLSSGIDWKTLIQVMVDRFAGRLELTRHLLNSSTTDPDEIIDLANKTYTQLRIMLTPYITFSTTPTDPSNKGDLDWTIPVYKLCAGTHTYSMESALDSMTDSEKLILQAIQGTTREICRVVTKMWAAGVYAGIDSSLNTKECVDIVEITRVWNSWAEDLTELMAWLDWSVWVKCSPNCSPEEMCYLPTWPIGFPGIPWKAILDLPGSGRQRKPLTGLDLRTMAKKNFAEDVSSIVKPEPDEWIRPQPKCVIRVDPYAF